MLVVVELLLGLCVGVLWIYERGKYAVGGPGVCVLCVCVGMWPRVAQGATVT